MTTCPHCNRELKVIDGSVKFAVNLSEDEPTETQKQHDHIKEKIDEDYGSSKEEVIK